MASSGPTKEEAQARVSQVRKDDGRARARREGGRESMDEMVPTASARANLPGYRSNRPRGDVCYFELRPWAHPWAWPAATSKLETVSWLELFLALADACGDNVRGKRKVGTLRKARLMELGATSGQDVEVSRKRKKMADDDDDTGSGGSGGGGGKDGVASSSTPRQDSSKNRVSKKKGKRAAKAAAAEAAAAAAAAGNTEQKDGNESLTDAEIDQLVRLITAVTPDEFSSPRFRRVRKALHPFVETEQKRRFGNSGAFDYATQKRVRRETESRQARQKALDRRHKDLTMIRCGRIVRLKELCEDAAKDGVHLAGDLSALALEAGELEKAKLKSPALLEQPQPAPVEGGDGGAAGAGEAAGEGHGEAEEGTGAGGVITGKDVVISAAGSHETTSTQAAVAGARSRVMQVPDGAVRDDPSKMRANEAANNATADEGGAGEVVGRGSGSKEERGKLFRPQQCYTCKRRFTELHAFYALLCPPCAALNYRHRHATADMRGRVALVTGARVKIGYEITLKLLRAGATVLATTRFPADAARRYAAEADFGEWRGRLQLHALDLRDIARLEAFCNVLCRSLDRLDVIVNNACQTIRRPAGYYKHLLPLESRLEAAIERRIALGDAPAASAADDADDIVATSGDDGVVVADKSGKANEGSGRCDTEAVDVESFMPMFAQQTVCHRVLRGADDGSIRRAPPAIDNGDAQVEGGSGGDSNSGAAGGGSRTVDGTTSGALPPRPSPAQLSQVQLLPEDAAGSGGASSGILPTGRLDVNEQQIDLRRTNSWLLKLGEVSTPEVVEVFAINALSPFIINSHLLPLMRRSNKAPPQAAGNATTDSTTGDSSGGNSSNDGCRAADGGDQDVDRFIVNVSAMEGKFYRHKQPTHPHTNMAKAALNMLTRTSAGDLAKDRIYMTCVDTGWINDENPRDKAVNIALRSGFQTPLDEIDAAARVLHPVFDALSGGKPMHGCFLKDYLESEW